MNKNHLSPCIALALVFSLAGCELDLEDDSWVDEDDIGTSAAPLVISQCPTSNYWDVRDPTEVMRDNWSDFKSYAWVHEGIRLSSCLKGRLQNGTVRCQQTTTNYCTGGELGRAYPGNPLVRVCRDWLNQIRSSLSANQRRTCYGSEIAHEFSHSCFGNEARAEKVEEAALGFLNGEYGVSVDHYDCNTDWW